MTLCVNSGQALGDLEQGAQLGCHRHSPGERQQGSELREEAGLQGKGEERDAKEAVWMDPADGTLRKRGGKSWELAETSNLGGWKDGGTELVKEKGSLGER